MNIEVYRPFLLRRLLSGLEEYGPFPGEEIEYFLGNDPGIAYPAVEITEDEKNYYLEAETPGISEKELDVYVEDGILTLKGEKKEEPDHKEGKVHRSERYYGRFSRSFTLPEQVNTDGIRAYYQKGILKLTLPKTEGAEPKRVEVKIH